MRAQGSWGRRRLGTEDGFTLIELLVVGIVLTIVLAGLTDLFTSGTNAEFDQNNRVQAQQQARVGLDRFRREARCASSVTLNSASSVTLALPGWCVRTTLTTAVTIPAAGLTSTTLNVVSSAAFGSAPYKISFANANVQSTVTCTGIGAGTFTGCTGGGDGVGNQTYAVGTIVTNTTASTVTWCVPTSGSGSSKPYWLARFVGSCGAGSAGQAFAQYLTQNSIFAETVMPAATPCTPGTTCPAAGGAGQTLGLGPYFYDVTAVCSGVEIPGTVTSSVAFSSGTTNAVSLSWSAYSCPGGGSPTYKVYGRDSNGLRLIASPSSSPYTDKGPVSTTTSDSPNLSVPGSGTYTVNVASTTGFFTDPNTGNYGISFGPSGPVSCTGATATSFTTCSGGTSGSYPVGTLVVPLVTARPPAVILGVTLNVSTRPKKATATSAFQLTDNVALRNSRPF